MKYIAIILFLLAFGLAGRWDFDDENTQYQYDGTKTSCDTLTNGN